MKNFPMISVAQGPQNWQIAELWYFLLMCNGIHLKLDDRADIYSLVLADLIDPVYDLHHLSKYRCIWIMDLCDIEDPVNPCDNIYTKAFANLKHDNMVLITQNHAAIESFVPTEVKIIKHDLLHNRSKLYYTSNQNHGVNGQGYQPWYYQSSDSYSRPSIPKEFVRFQIDLCNSTVFRKNKFLFAAKREKPARDAIYNTVTDFSDQGYIFYKNNRLPADINRVPSYTPFPTNIYENSFVNCYNETNVANYILHRTEKTIEPIIRFQMILPLASVGFIEYLKTLGITIVDDLIITPYDHIVDTQKRIDAYCTNLRQVLTNYTINDLSEMYYDNMTILLANHHNFFDRPYCQNIKHILDL